MNNTKQKILEKAFALFLEKGYDAVSISDLQNELEIGRASLYHHFKSKNDLFNNVVIHCYLEMGKAKHLRDTKNLTLSAMLDENIQQHKKALAHHNSFSKKSIALINYYLFAFQAIKYCPGFKEEALDIYKLEIEQWKQVIKNSIDSGELREDIDVEETAKLFINAENGIGIKATRDTPLNTVIDDIEKMYSTLYALIKT